MKKFLYVLSIVISVAGFAKIEKVNLQESELEMNAKQKIKFQTSGMKLLDKIAAEKKLKDDSVIAVTTFCDVKSKKIANCEVVNFNY